MSDILIRGMEMPQNAFGCEVIIRIQPNGEVLDLNGFHIGAHAVSVPPHGRLIDADALLEWARERDDGGPVNWVDSLDLTIWAGHHTIIEAEEGIK